MRVNRRLVLALLGLSLAGLGIFAWAAASHGPEPTTASGDRSQDWIWGGETATTQASHGPVWGWLWAGAAVASLGIGLAFLLFRREVRHEKARIRRWRDRKDLVRQVREYETGPGRLKEFN